MSAAQPPWIRKFDEFQALTVAWKEEEFNPPTPLDNFLNSPLHLVMKKSMYNVHP